MSLETDGVIQPDLPATRLTLDIFSEIYSSQMANGLRQKNFIRYRAYCSRRLRRLRKSVRFLHGKGKFIQKKVDGEVAQHPRHLLILLNLTERAWAHAMEIKTDVVEEASRSRFHMRRRLRKAMRWAEHMMKICDERADTFTCLQAECYYTWMSGNVYLEHEQLDKALAAFTRSAKVLNSLLDIAETEQQREIYRSRINLIQPSIRFCQYKTKQGAATGSDMPLDADLDVVLSSKLAAAREERDAQIIANAVDHITFKNRSIPIKSETVKNAIAKACALKSTIDDSSSANTFLSCFDALDVARSAILSSLKNPELNDTDKACLNDLLAFVSFNKLQVTLQRDLNLFKQLSCQDQGSKVSSDDLAVMCEKILSSLSSLQAEDAPVDPNLQNRFLAHRYFYLGKKLAAQGIWEGAVYFFEKSISTYPTSDTEFITQARQASVIARLSINSEDDVVEDGTDISNIPLMQRLEKWHEGSGLIAELPPSFVSTQCKPVQFDLAAAGLTYPSLESKLSRRTSTATGWLSRLWG